MDTPAGPRTYGARKPYSQGRAFLLGVGVVLSSAFINLLPFVLALRGTAPDRIEGKYDFMTFVHAPALLVVDGPLPSTEFFTGRVGSFPARLAGSALLWAGWLPWALLAGLLLVGLGWRTKDLWFERRLVLKGFFFSEAAWWVLFFFAGPNRDSPWLNMAAFMIGLPLVKFFHLYLAARGSALLRVPPRRAWIAGTVAGCMVIYWFTFFFLFEEFNHVEEMRQAALRRRVDEEEKDNDAPREEVFRDG